jgi:hypothetical protein
MRIRFEVSKADDLKQLIQGGQLPGAFPSVMVILLYND